jgi:cytochrome c-type biogenesis protein CcmF
VIIELGHFALVLALFVALIQATVPILGAQQGRASWMRLGYRAPWSLCGLVSIALFSLVHAYALSDFSVLNVYQNSHTLKPTIYKLAGLWSNHEGSMLLWVWMLSAWGAAVARNSKSLPQPLMARVVSVQGMIAFGFILFILSNSSPFTRLDPPPPEGLDMNPILQDPLLAIHPPFLYAGYVGFSISFCFAIAALLEKKVDAEWAAFLRPWVLSAWCALTIGIALGATWAYYELGWGGFWFWDPVENASLMPWLAGTALLHSVAVLEKRGTLKSWTIFLAIFAFSLSLLGTFIVRSGILTSVHAFAVDPARGIFILALLGIVIGGALLLYALRAPYITMGDTFKPVSRETALLLNNVFLFTFAATVFVGTLYPVFLSALNAGSVSVGAPYYSTALTPLLIPFALLMGAGPGLAWKEANLQAALKRLGAPFAAAAVLAGVIALLPLPGRPFTPVMFFVGGWVLFATLNEFLRKTRYLTSWRNLPRSFYGMTLAHTGFALLLIGAVTSTSWVAEKTLWMKPRDIVTVAGHDVLFLGVEPGIGQNYDYDRGNFTVPVSVTNDEFAVLKPEKRWYPATERSTSETALHLFGLDMLYLVMGDQDEKNPSRWTVRIYYHPFIGLLAIGAALIALGALAAMRDRRHRGDA